MNRHIVIGWIGGRSELLQDFDFNRGKRVAKELEKSTQIWKPVYCGSLMNLITLLEKGAAFKSKVEEWNLVHMRDPHAAPSILKDLEKMLGVEER